MPSLYIILSLLYLSYARPQEQPISNSETDLSASYEDIPLLSQPASDLIEPPELDSAQIVESQVESVPRASQTIQSPAEPNIDASQSSSLLQDQLIPPGSTATGIPSGSCKWVPSQSGWPSDADWAALNQAVKGRLLRPPPPAAACHGLANGDCDSVKSGFRDSKWHANNPVSNMWQNYNNYSCPPTGGQCSGWGYPVYVVEAREPGDVKAAIDFARQKTIRLNVKSTGHDFLGRSVQPYSLSIWTHRLTNQKWYTTSFTPKNCRFSIAGAAVTAGAGSQWSSVTSQAKDRSLAVVSGAFGTVSLGGFLSNGGHGALSAKFGLGADQVYEIDLVTPMGDIITANECQNQEYFWAMRGGGGSTYGVALAYTIKAYPSMPSASYRTSLNGWSEISYWFRNWPKLAMIGASGYFNGYPGRGDAVRVSFSVPNITRARLESVVQPIMAQLGESGNFGSGGVSQTEGSGDRGGRRKRWLARWRRALGRNDDGKTESVARQRGEFREYATWAEAEAAYIEGKGAESHSLTKRAYFPGMGTNKILASWLWSAQDLQNPNLEKALRGAFDSAGQMLTDATMGVGTHNPPFIRGGGNAVNPAFRTAVMRPATELQWTGSDFPTLEKKRQDSLRFVKSYMSIAPEGGTYANEADPDTPDWPRAFWGSNYPKLLEIKRRVDPYGVFYCRSCVGSELWVDNYGQLCRL